MRWQSTIVATVAIAVVLLAGVLIQQYGEVAVVEDGRLQIGEVIAWQIDQLDYWIAPTTRQLADWTKDGIEWLVHMILVQPLALTVVLAGTVAWGVLPRPWFWGRLGAASGLIVLGLVLAQLMPATSETVAPWIVIVLLTAECYWLTRRLGVAVFTAGGLALLLNMGLWVQSVQTFTLVILATFVTIVLGVPLGILGAVFRPFNAVLTPILDFMQTLPAFVYLIPAIAFFSLGETAALFATVIFAMPPAIRLTTLGIQQVPEELVEAADAFGSTRVQKLLKLELPTAMPSIQAGVNQAIMLSLSMVVIAAMIGAPGLGDTVWTAIQRLNVGMGFEGGLGIVILAMILDRTLRSAGRKARAEAN